MRIFNLIGLLAIAVSGTINSSAWSIVTSDYPGSHWVPTGSTAFGLNLDGVVIVELQGIDLYTGLPKSTYGTGAVLDGGNYILTAAHVVEPALYTGPLSDFLVDHIIIHYNWGSPSYSTESFGGGGFYNVVQDHPSYRPHVLQPWNGYHAGYDVALIQVHSVPSGMPGYSIDTLSKDTLYGWSFIVAGRGNIGDGIRGEQPLRACYALCAGEPMQGVWQGSPTPAMSRMTNGPSWLHI